MILNLGRRTLANLRKGCGFAHTHCELVLGLGISPVEGTSKSFEGEFLEMGTATLSLGRIKQEEYVVPNLFDISVCSRRSWARCCFSWPQDDFDSGYRLLNPR